MSIEFHKFSLFSTGGALSPSFWHFLYVLDWGSRVSKLSLCGAHDETHAVYSVNCEIYGTYHTVRLTYGYDG